MTDRTLPHQVLDDYKEAQKFWEPLLEKNQYFALRALARDQHQRAVPDKAVVTRDICGCGYATGSYSQPGCAILKDIVHLTSGRVPKPTTAHILTRLADLRSALGLALPEKSV